MTQNNEEEKPIGPITNAWAMPMPGFNKGDMKHSLQEESKFEVIFPRYREKYLKACWPFVEKNFEEYGIKSSIDLLAGSMSVSTTRKTWDPFVILKARDVIKLLGRSVPAEQAVKVLRDDMSCEIMKIKGLVRNKAVLVKRRQRLIGANGTALKALELLTDCYILVQGCTVSAIGPYNGIQQVERVVKSTMKNVHPVNLLKVLMVQKSLAKDPEMKNEDWSKFIPKFTHSNVQRKKPKKIRVKKPYTPFPPERVASKKDEYISSGKSFLEREAKKETYGKPRYNKDNSNKYNNKPSSSKYPNKKTSNTGNQKFSSKGHGSKNFGKNKKNSGRNKND